ncbi:GNAT family N-acetyltransferase [Micromonospora sp. WMMD1155]|uniref:GNAT family N-acetyltransferase n=1 Tax=Micromonospora sp. WMMD1155 TaxID=3016094 RepID=UPI00249AB3F2|nr:GNAT family N-acetyltransferase [Micromonospora sp. WMMD1155]WFE54857.1 GNAT family N-acetyltransferase [Micromonospora sp. WMMD1155]
MTQVRSLRDIPEDDWNELTESQSAFSCQPWLRFVEERVRLRCSYLLWHHEGRLAAALPLYRGPLRNTGQTFSLPALLQDQATAVEGSPADGTVILLGAAYGYHNDGLLLASWLGPDDRAAVGASLSGFLRESVEARDVVGAFLMNVDRGTIDALARAGFATHVPAAVLNVTARLDVVGDDFDGYVAHLPHSRRPDVRRERRMFAQAGLTCTVSTGPEPLADIAVLAEETYRRHGYPPSPPAEFQAMLEALQARFGERCVHFLVHDTTGALTAASTGFVQNDTLVIPWFGVRAEADRAGAPYFNTCFYEPLRYAQEHGLKKVDLGIEALSAKVLRGCSLSVKYGVTVTAADRAAAWEDAILTFNRRQRELLGERAGAAARKVVATLLAGDGVEPREDRVEAT